MLTIVKMRQKMVIFYRYLANVVNFGGTRIDNSRNTNYNENRAVANRDVYLLLKEIMMRDKVEEVLNKIRPALIRDGGNVELVDVDDGTVKLKLVGACAGCPMSTMTLKMGIERIMRQEIPEVKEVVAV
jgi:Fe-S cluster biogenesis protein NfuA